MWGIPLPGWTEVQSMSSVKEHIIKRKVLAALIRVNILKNNWRSKNWRIIVSNGRVSEEKYCISGSPAAIIVYGQLPSRSWSTIGCHYSPQSLSTAAIRIHHQLPPRSWSTTIIRCQHDKGSAISITISQHDSESTILGPPLRSLIRDPQIIIHDVVTAGALDLRTIRQRDSGEELKSETCIDEIWISLIW